MAEVSVAPNKTLQATSAASSVLDVAGDSQLPAFVAVSFPAPVPEFKRYPGHFTVAANEVLPWG